MNKEKTITKKKESSEILVRPDTSVEVLIAQAIDKNVSIETMEKLMAMRRELKAEFAKAQFDKAMARFQEDCPIIQKTTEVKNKDGTVRYRYAALDAIVSQVKEVLGANGLSSTIKTIQDDKGVTAVCVASHEDGHAIESTFTIPIDRESYMSAPQRIAAALTYAKRYAFCNVFGIMTGDDDNDAVEDAEDKKSGQPIEGKIITQPGGINQGQLETIKILSEKLGVTFEKTDEWRFTTTGHHINEMTIEQGKKMIDVLQKRLKFKENAGDTQPVGNVLDTSETEEQLLAEFEAKEKERETPQAVPATKPEPNPLDYAPRPLCASCGTEIIGLTVIPRDTSKLLCKLCYTAGKKPGAYKTIVNPNEPPFPSRPGETIH